MGANDSHFISSYKTNLELWYVDWDSKIVKLICWCLPGRTHTVRS